MPPLLYSYARIIKIAFAERLLMSYQFKLIGFMEKVRKMIKPVFNKDTGKYDVFAYGKNHEFDDLQSAWDYANEVVNDYFSDSVFLAEN